MHNFCPDVSWDVAVAMVRCQAGDHDGILEEEKTANLGGMLTVEGTANLGGMLTVKSTPKS